MTAQQRWVPEGATAVEAADIPAIVYMYERNGIPCGLAYSGAKGKADWHNQFSHVDRAKYVAEYFEGLRRRKAMMDQRHADRIAYQHTLKIGDILYSSWGYDQTNIDFYEVVKVMGKNVVIRKLAQQQGTTGFMCGTCRPVAGRFVGEPMTKRVMEDNTIKIASAHAWLWDGQTKHWTDGH